MKEKNTLYYKHSYLPVGGTGGSVVRLVVARGTGTGPKHTILSERGKRKKILQSLKFTCADQNENSVVTCILVTGPSLRF